MSDLAVQEFVDAGAHIGCRVSRWNPKMEPYIYGSRNRIHIIDLKLTIRGILRARHFLREIVASGQDVLFVGTKPQIQAEIRRVHEQTTMPYVDDRWIGGTLTNYDVIGSRLAYLEDLEKKESEGFLDTLSSKAASRFMREKRKVHRNLHGIRDMFRLPGALVVVDPKTDANAVREANKMGIPVVGIVDTDCDPEVCDIVIPANDDAIRSVSLILSKLIDSVLEGRRLREERGVQPHTRPEPVDAGVPVPRPRPGASRPRPSRGSISEAARRVPITPVDEGAPEAEAPEKSAREADAPQPPARETDAPEQPAREADAPEKPSPEGDAPSESGS